MSLSNIFDIAGSGMNAQSMRMNTTASNLSNAQTASGTAEGVYRAKHPVFEAVQQQLAEWNSLGANQNDAAAVRVKGVFEDQTAAQARYEPGHSLADEEGYVFYPNVNVVEEMSNMISASRSFQINVEVMNSAKTMAQRVLSLGQ
ncbi:MAG: flagellar basal body rod protein FlgC [Pseudomonadales bacterium]